MSKAAADVEEERKASFKKGLGDGLTDRRAQDSVKLRKQKHASALSRRRGIERPDVGGQLERMMALYRRQDIIAAGDATQLRLLHDILECATTPFLDEQVPTLLGDGVIPVLVKHCAESEQCAIIMQQLTGIVTKHDIIIARDIVKSGFLNVMAANEQNAMRPTFWNILLNICLSCREGRIEVLGSPLFVNSIFQQVAPRVQPAQVLSVTCALIEADECEPLVNLIAFMWPLLMHTLINVTQPLPWGELDETQRILINASTGILRGALFGLNHKKRPDINIRLLMEKGTAPSLIRKLTALLRSCKETGLEVRILEIMVRISALPLPTHELHIMMREAGSVRDMITQAQRPTTVARYWAFLWIGNYMADGATFVQEMLTADVMSVLVSAMERGEADVKAKAIYAVMTAFSACDQEQDNVALADQMLHTLVFGHKIFARLAEHITSLPGHEQITTDILKCLAAGLRWNRARVMQSLKAYHVHERIEDVLSELKGNLDTEVYQLATEVDDMLQGRAPESRDAALEAAANAALGMDIDMSNGRVLAGRFEF
jgi:hypothetical protein